MGEPATLRSPTRKNRVLRAIAKGGGSLTRLISDRGWIGIWGTVQHIGRKSGTTYRAPVAVLSSGNLLIVPVPFGGATQWVQNVLAEGGCVVRWKGHDTPVSEARLAEWPEVRPLTPRVVRPIIRLLGIRTFLVARRQARQSGDRGASGR